MHHGPTADGRRCTRPALQIDGTALHYRTAGDGPPLVLVHGSGTDLTTWDGVVDELARDHRVITYDRRGYGRSRHAPVRDHRVHARDLTAVLQQLAGGPATVVGWSAADLAGMATTICAAGLVEEGPSRS